MLDGDLEGKPGMVFVITFSTCFFAGETVGEKQQIIDYSLKFFSDLLTTLLTGGR
jgi:hypothetical protein